MRRKIYAFTMLLAMLVNIIPYEAFASSHREAPLIANDPLADNTDLYAFRSPDNPDKITIIANYVPGQLPQGGPNYYSFGENILYEIHVDNNLSTPGDDITYRFSFKKQNEDPTTFFNIRLGKQNLKTTYTLEKSTDGGKSFSAVIRNGAVPPPNIGPRSISGGAGLGATDYESLIKKSITTASSGEKVFCGTSDDPFFVDLGGIFDLGDAPRTTGTKPRDGLACLNVSTIAIQVDIASLQKDHKPVYRAKNILDPDYVVGIWASASRRKIRVLNTNKGQEGHSGPWVQVSRLGMPLTNEVIVPVGMKDYWNSLTPYEDLSKLKEFGNFFYNPELALYMDDALFGGAVPALSKLRVQKKSLGVVNFGNGNDGVFAFMNRPELKGTALDPAVFGKLLLPAPASPRSVDLWPIFNTGVPNLAPYQLAVGKEHPASKGKPFINNFLPNGGDMLRLNMAVPPTPRNDPKFSNLGLVQAAVLGLTDPAYNSNQKIQFIPNMDGFPNGRRLEDDVVRIELQAVGGIVLAAIGFWYDDFTGNPVTTDLLDVLTYDAGITKNDAPLKMNFPYVPAPWPGTHNCDCDDESQRSTERSIMNPGEIPMARKAETGLGLAAPEMNISAYPNPIDDRSTIRYSVDQAAHIRLAIYDIQGKLVNTVLDKKQDAGVYTVVINTRNLAKGTYVVVATKDGVTKQTVQLVKK